MIYGGPAVQGGRDLRRHLQPGRQRQGDADRRGVYWGEVGVRGQRSEISDPCVPNPIGSTEL